MLNKLQSILNRKHVLLFFCTLAISVSVHAAGQVDPPELSRKISITVDRKPLKNTLDQISSLAQIPVMYSNAKGITSKLVSLKESNQPVSKVLTDVLTPFSLYYEAIDGRIVVRSNTVKQELAPNDKTEKLRPPVKGKVTDHSGKPLEGATIRIKNGKVLTTTDNTGSFTIQDFADSTVIQISFVSYKSKELVLTDQSYLNVVLEDDEATLQEVNVIATGYQDVSKERITGSVDQIDNKLLNRSSGVNILDRLNAIASGLIFNGTAINSISTNQLDRSLGINIRGQSTLSDNVSKDPLIVLDNFPYEGNINNINPNDIESVTILKDAAAASIWGARSGNGVIVLTTKKGRKNQPITIDINSSVTIQNKPNLYYDRNFLNSSAYIDVESYLFKQGYFDSFLNDTYDQAPVSPVVDILAKERDGTLSTTDASAQINSLRQNYVRKDYEKYIYQKAAKQQYSLGLRGGTAQNSYTFSAGYDKNQDNLVRNGFDRITINALNVYSPIKNLEITTAINYSRNATDYNNQLYYGSGISVGGYGPIAGLYPYAQFAGPDGSHLSIVKDYRAAYANSAVANGLLDWNYRPLDELKLADNNTMVNDLILRAGIKYKFSSFLNAEVQYQNEKQTVQTYNYQNEQTYAARNLINQFTIVDPTTESPTYQVPIGGILNLGNNELTSNNFRGQLNFNYATGKHNISAIAGTEIRQTSSEAYSRTSLGYDDQYGTSNNSLDYADYILINPAGYGQIPSPSGTVTGIINRFVSYYANGAYTYDDRYTFTLSGRKDGANIFGVKTNDKVTPLWSTGLAWNIGKEDFYKVSWLPFLKARLSYGFNGNVYNGTAYVTGNYTTAALTKAPTILNLTAPNPDLRWEKVKNIDAGIDFATKNNWLSGTIDYYTKSGQDLVENVPLYSSSGFLSFYGNAASTTTKGFDITLNTKNINGIFKWGTTVLLSMLHDKVTKYDGQFLSYTFQNGGVGVPVVGKPLYGIYSYKWAGLDPENGDPRGYLNGKVSKDYTGIIGNYQPDSLVYNGSARPTVYGAFRNDFAYRNFSLSVNIVYELGYVFRRSSTSINYQDIISSYNGQNIDYDQRWQKPGDEVKTNVPSIIYPSDANRNTFYQYSQVLVDNADNIRLQDIRLAYNLTKAQWRHSPFSALQIYGYASNLGIIWRANKYGIDPDVPSINSHGYPNPFTISLGFNATL